jgi:TrmH family RNA methyltransferase
MPATIASRRHPLVATCRRLAAGARDDRLVLLDGERLIRDALASGVRLRALLASTEDATLEAAAAEAGAEIVRVTAAVLDAASPVRTPSGVVAIAEWPDATLDAALGGTHPVVLGLDGIQDPGNVGAIVRSADALGATGVIATGGTADPRSWKALRGAMGSTFRLPVARSTVDEVLAQTTARHLRVVASVADAGVPLDRAQLVPPLLIWLGSEGAGLSRRVLESADALVHLPMRAGVNSLNVAVAAALVLYEARRQQPSASPPA